MNQEACVIPIFRTSNSEHLREIMASADISLENNQIRWLSNAEY
jgi:diketogulonate reductase-like aldo/keto reductase